MQRLPSVKASAQMDRFVPAKEVAATIAFFLSDAPLPTGQSLIVDSGLLTNCLVASRVE